MRSHQDQRGIAGVERRITVDADDIKVVAINQLREGDVIGRRFVGLQGNADLSHVKSSLFMMRLPMRSIFIIRRSSGSGQATSESRSIQSPADKVRCLAASNGSTELRA